MKGEGIDAVERRGCHTPYWIADPGANGIDKGRADSSPFAAAGPTAVGDGVVKSLDIPRSVSTDEEAHRGWQRQAPAPCSAGQVPVGRFERCRFARIEIGN